MATKMKAKNKISMMPQDTTSHQPPFRGANNVPLLTASPLIQPVTSSELLNLLEHSSDIVPGRHDPRAAYPGAGASGRPSDSLLSAFVNVVPPKDGGAYAAEGGVDIAAPPTPQKNKTNKIKLAARGATPTVNAGSTLSKELLNGSIYGKNSPKIAHTPITAAFTPPTSMDFQDHDDPLKDSLLLSNRTIPPPQKQFDWGSASLERACSAENIRDILGVHSDGSLSGMEYSDQYSDQGDKKEALLRKEVAALKRRKTGFGKKILRKMGLMKKKKPNQVSAMDDASKIHSRPVSADDLMWLRKSTVMSFDDEDESGAQLLWCRDTDESESDDDAPCGRTSESPADDGTTPRDDAAQDGNNAPSEHPRSVDQTATSTTKENGRAPDSKSSNKLNASSEIEYDAEETKDENEGLKSGVAQDQEVSKKKSRSKEESEMEYRFSSSSSSNAAAKVRFDVPPVATSVPGTEDGSTKGLSSAGPECQRAPLSVAEKPEPHGLPYIVVAHQGCSLRENYGDTAVADWIDYGEIVWAVNRRRAKFDGKTASWYYIQIDVEGGPSWVSQCDPSTNSTLLSPVRVTSASKIGNKSFVATRSLKTRCAPVHPPSKGKSRHLYAGYVLKPRALARVKCEEGDLRFLQHPDGSWLLQSLNSTDLLVEIKTTKINKEYVTNAKCPLMPGPCAGKATNTLEEGTIVHATSMCKPANSQSDEGTYVYLVEDSSKLSKPIGWAKLEHLSQMTVSDHQACYVLVAKNVHLLDSPSKLSNHETSIVFKVSDRLDMLRKVQVHLQVPYYETLVYFELISGGFVALKNAKTDKVQLEFERYNPPSTKNVSRRFPYPLPDAVLAPRKQSPLPPQRGGPSSPPLAHATSGQSDQSNSSGEYPAPAAVPTTRHDQPPSYGPPGHNTARTKTAQRSAEPVGRSSPPAPHGCSPKHYAGSPTGRDQPCRARDGSPYGITRSGHEPYTLHRHHCGAPNDTPPRVSPIRNRPHPNSSGNLAAYQENTYDIPSCLSHHSTTGYSNGSLRRGEGRAMTMNPIRSAPPLAWNLGVQGQHVEQCDPMHLPRGYSHCPVPPSEHPTLYEYHKSYPGSWGVSPPLNDTPSRSSQPSPSAHGTHPAAGSPYHTLPSGAHYGSMPVGTQHGATSAHYGSIPAGTQYGPTHPHAHYGSMLVGTQPAVTSTGAHHGSPVSGTQCAALSTPSSSPDGFIVEKKTTTQQAFYNYR